MTSTKTRRAYIHAISIWNKKLEVLDSKLIGKNVSYSKQVNVIQEMLHDTLGIRRNLDWMEESLIKLLTELRESEG
ncbi:hypothetical protein TaPaz_127 [Acinetobacter phage TaPaz]|nr:hypothetical protein TaPaz_127 [Acinetobacter phage TaPaz]